MKFLVQSRLFPDAKSVDFAIFKDFTGISNQNETSTKKIIPNVFSNFLFHPLGFHHSFLLLWRILDLCFILIYLFKLPYETCFREKILIEDNKFEVCFIIFAIFGCFMNFNAMFLSRVKVDMSHSLIFWKYLKSFFIIDILGLVALVVHYSDQSSFLSFLYIIKIMALQNNFKHLIDYFTNFANYHAFYSATIWMFYFLVISHILSCSFFSLANRFSSFKVSFIIKSDISKFHQYLYSFYFINSNINLFGRYLESTILNDFELIWIIMLNFLPQGFLVYIYYKFFRKSYFDGLATFNKFMKKKGVSINLQRKINNYFNCVSKKEEALHNQDKFMNKLGINLKKQLFMESYLPVLRSIPFFSNNFSEKTLFNLSAIVQERSLKPGELVYGDDYICNHFYYILNGELECFFNKQHQYSSTNDIKRLSEGDSFGELAFFGSNIEKLNLRSVTDAHLLTISVEDFLAEVKKVQHDYEVYCRIKDAIFLYKDYSNLHKNCFFCQDLTHCLSNCPLVHYFPSNSRIINTSKHNDRVFRKCFVRKLKIKSLHALKSFKKINDRATYIQSKLSIDQRNSIHQNSTHKKSSSLIRAPKESFLYNEDNSSNSSYTFTQKKRLNDSPLLPPLKSDSFSTNVFNKINEERKIYKQVYTSRSINSDYMAYDPYNNSSDFKMVDFNKLRKVSGKIDSFSYSFDKSTFTSFENVKIWSNYFPQNNIMNILKGFGKRKKKKTTIINNSRKEEILNKSILSSKKMSTNMKEGLLQKIKRKKRLRKSKTEIETNVKNRRRSWFDTIKTFFKT